MGDIEAFVDIYFVGKWLIGLGCGVSVGSETPQLKNKKFGGCCWVP